MQITRMSNIPPNSWWNNPRFLPCVILSFAALNIIFLGGKRRAFGGFVAELHKDFSNITLTELNWIGSSYSAFAYITSGVSTTLILHFNRRYGRSQLIGSLFILFSSVSSSFVPNPHWLFFTHTMFHGIGSSLIISTIGLVVNEHFNTASKYRILATTLISGGSFAAVAFVYFFAFLIQSYDWRISFVILGVIYFVVNSSAAIFFTKSNNITETSSETCAKQFQKIKNNQLPLLALWFIERVLTSVVTYGMLLNLTDYVYRIQHNLVRSSIFTTLFVVGEGATYLLAAMITALTRDYFKEKLGYILFSTSVVTGITLMTMEFTRYMPIVSRMLCCLSGFGLGFSNTLLYPAGEELTLLPGHIAYPFTLGGMGFGMLISPLLTAKIAEIFVYKLFFFIQGCLIFSKALCILVILILLAYHKKHGTESVEDEREQKVNLTEETTRLLPETIKKSE